MLITSSVKSWTPVKIEPDQVHECLSKHMLVDGFDLVADMVRSKGSKIFDSRNNRYFIDFFTFFASSPIGLNHPKLLTEEFKEKLLNVSINKPTNSDVYTVEMAEFVETFSRIAIPDFMKYLFLIDGGTLGNENGLKTAFDWKIRKNFKKGYKEEKGNQVIHFTKAFHGRSGYTLSLTNTNPVKTQYFPKFKWPRITAPIIEFPVDEMNIEKVKQLERIAVAEIKQAIIDNPDDIAVMIIEPIQGEGGDNHFRKEFFIELRTLCDENDILLMFDEVQTGIGLTGKMWAYEHFVKPDIFSFGKKSQVCGFLVSDKIDEIEDNVFHVSSRINSTWGGNLTDMVRFEKYLEVIEEENLVQSASVTGAYLLNKLIELQNEFPNKVKNARGLGLMCAFDFSTSEEKDIFRKKCYDNGLIILCCGECAVRFRPALNITKEEIDEGIDIIRKSL